MQRRTTSVLALAAVGAIALVSGYVVSQRNEPAAAAVSNPAPSAAPTAMPAINSTPVSADVAPAASAPEDVTRWIADATGGDAAKRATAIAALANAPRAEVLPTLRRILTNGEPEIDRPLALRSLRDLALSQGDADGAIRDAVRQAIYHGDDLTRTEDVQEVLDIIEESELK